MNANGSVLTFAANIEDHGPEEGHAKGVVCEGGALAVICIETGV